MSMTNKNLTVHLAYFNGTQEASELQLADEARNNTVVLH